ncbi:hypothetical protein ABPG74_013897 [Tetrahymena malaccensis]
MGRRSHSRSRSRSKDRKKDKHSSHSSSTRDREKQKELERREKEAKKRSRFSDVPLNDSTAFSNKFSSSFSGNGSGGANSSWQQQNQQYSPNKEEGPTDIQTLIEQAKRTAQLNEAFGKVPQDRSGQDFAAGSDLLGGLSIPGLSIVNGVGINTTPKPATAAQTIVRNIDIPQDNNFNYVGLILGPKGSNQKRIQEKTRCRIIIKSDQIPPHVQIAGSSEKDVADACCEIERILFSDEETRNKIKSEQLKEVADMNNSVQQNRLVVRVPQNFVGLILGKGGETIRSIKTQCGASYIQMDSNQVQGEDYKNFTVFGTQDQCEKAQKLIFDYIESYKSNSKKEIFEVPVELVGGFIGKSGCNIQNINKSSGARLIMNNNNETVRGNKLFEIVGNAQQIQNAIHLAQNLLDQLKSTHQGQFGGGAAMQGYNNNYPPNGQRDPHQGHGSSERGDDRSRNEHSQQNYYQGMQPPQMMGQDPQQLQQQYQQQQMLMQQYYQQQLYYQQYYQQMANPQIEEITIDQSKR